MSLRCSASPPRAPVVVRREEQRTQQCAVDAVAHMAVARGSAASALHLHHDLHVAGYNQVLLVVQVKLSKGALGVVVQVVLT